MSNSSRISFVVYLLGATIFAMTTAEFMVAGMMPSLAAALDVSVGEVGFLISYYALGMTIGGPILTALLLALGLPHKPSLLWLLVLYIAGGALSAVATSYDMMVVGRIIMGVASSACFGVSLTICAGLVAPEARGRAASFVLGGLMFAPVFGVPITAIIEQHYGWRASFWAVAVLAMLCTLVVAWRVPRAENHESVSLSAEFRSLWNARLWAAYITSALIIGAAFCAFSYFTPIFTEITGFSAGIIPLLLMIYGISNVVGNMVVGRLADRYTMPVLAAGLALLAAALATFALFAHNPVISIIAFIAIGLTGVALNPAMAARVMRTASPGMLVNTMHSSVITGGLAFGAWAGGAAIDAGYGLEAPLWVGLILALAGLISVLPFLRFGKSQWVGAAT